MHICTLSITTSLVMTGSFSSSENGDDYNEFATEIDSTDSTIVADIFTKY